MHVRYLDLSVQDSEHKQSLLNAVDKVLSHGRVILGPEVEELEGCLADYCNRGFAVGVSSGTDALYVALRALDIGPGDEVITTPMSWVATLNAIVMSGATPVFVDIGPDLNIDPDLIAAAITPYTKAIIPVHYTGKMCDIDRIMAIAAERDLEVIEDAAQAFGAKTVDGRRAGSIGQLACFSMNSMKVFHSYGEAGAVLCDDESLSEKMQSIRYAGTVNREDCHYPSLNFRIQTMQAAMLLVEMERIEAIIQRRREIARLYVEALSGVVECPREEVGEQHVYYTFTIQVDDRDRLMAHLGEKGVETKIHHPFLMPEQTAYKDRFSPDIPNAQRLVKRILSLPNHEKMTDDEVAYVAATVKAFYGAG
jgi:dTDP-4-amino-4,6-dideoxygalactose transaminase